MELPYLTDTYNNIISTVAWHSCWRHSPHERSYLTAGPVRTRMGDRLWAGIPSQYVTSQLGQGATQPCIPPGSLNQVPASAGIKAQYTLAENWGAVPLLEGEAGSPCNLSTAHLSNALIIGRD